MQTHKVSGDNIRAIDGWQFTYRKLSTDPILLGVVSDTAIEMISQAVQASDIDLSCDSVLVSVDGLQALIEMAYLRGVQDGAPEKRTVYRCHRCSADLVYKDGAYQTIQGGDRFCTQRADGSMVRHIAGVL